MILPLNVFNIDCFTKEVVTLTEPIQKSNGLLVVDVCYYELRYEQYSHDTNDHSFLTDSWICIYLVNKIMFWLKLYIK